MLHFALFCFQVKNIGLLGGHLDRDTLHNGNAIAGKACNFLWVIGEQPELLRPQIMEDLGAYAVIAQIRGKSQFHVGFYRVKPFLSKPS